MIVKTQYIEKEQKPVLAVCEQCNNPIYNGNEIVRVDHGRSTKVLCKTCAQENNKKLHDEVRAVGIKHRIRSFVWSGIISGVALAIVLAATLSSGEATTIATGVVIALLLFPFLSCLFLKNNFIGDLYIEVASWGFVRFPGLIFELDLDGILWLITVKLLFWILGFLLSTATMLLATVVGMVLSVFVYPFALAKNIRNPEEFED